ncbi:NAD(P)-dependent dehydrogenase, short-chain alcohol dehydrogenase family [Parapedobacter composti]|uniref:NAD(P)-dependent dehydrogenase, short-chain alcohol dehydrogenase family n=1 Tax=Parapedobacter composti TaxID=623281 RepID=A0A1I1MWD1_9SPHI|nr:SDR family oxidoreductase [Parapedobacter composti]SFC86883.1 NAD(P)-dependent dehydrogenase, short-chain alcohol dehydrogenase family [Parapedobacter composti]
MERKTYLIFGVSKGLGRAITLNLPDGDDQVFGISRSEPDYLSETPSVRWISADLSNPVESVKTLKQHIGNTKIDYLIYNVGIWESDAFSDDYNFVTNAPEELISLIHTNLTSCILGIQSMIENLKKANQAKIILIGSTWGLDNHNGKEVTFSATKFALRGVAHSLRENLRENRIGVSVLNLGYLAMEGQADEVMDAGIETTTWRRLIPLQDVILALKFIISTSDASCVKEINMPAMDDNNM